ncbi:MAG: carbamate kinase [Chloroflexi bacterium]|nr:carbamate kinase [Chloroflexota bacterium]MBK6710185.1 carbamate kinase [Chloroflexota bacterium]MBK7178493.1 carbamate kinase [Chloroflexota bacterium]MBK7920443.1 carbamate kinase [Chloroflexota bacterium]MBK8933442.1 carbamate kinase [Chloroflexota bacterium]
MSNKLAVVAVGGNSLITDKHHPDVPHQWDAVRETCRHLADMVEDGWTLVVTHGNGPQVGYILRRNELAAHEVHATPLDVIGADTQGSIGYMLQQALRNELNSRGINKPVVSVVTQVLVDRDDPGFKNPTKPIGSFMEEADARKFEAEGWQVVEDAGRGWRRVVASPIPLEVVEQDAIQTLTSAGNIVIAVGGGGIPVVQNQKGELRELSGVFAVIDKDRASALLAQQIGADLLLISTAVEKVALNFGKPNEQWLDHMTLAEAKAHMAEGTHFAKGSMAPKIEAVITFLEAGGKKALITDPANIARALRGETGTFIEP